MKPNTENSSVRKAPTVEDMQRKIDSLEAALASHNKDWRGISNANRSLAATNKSLELEKKALMYVAKGFVELLELEDFY